MRERIAAARMKSDSVLKALRRMAFERYEEIAVQSLHLIPGMEYDGVLGDVELARREHVMLEVCSAFSDAPGTIVG